MNLFAFIIIFINLSRKILPKISIILWLLMPHLAYSETLLSKLSYNSETQLLQKFLPEIYISMGSARPVDFDTHYLMQSALMKNHQMVKTAPLSAKDVKPIENERDIYYVDYQGSHEILTNANKNQIAPIYGRVYYETLTLPKNIHLPDKPVIILKYNVVFTASGLPKILNLFQNIFATLAGNKTIWHELDIHGAVILMLDAQSLQPMALLLAQHNYYRSYIFNHDLTLPENNHIAICYAIRSNEPYLCPNKLFHAPTIGDPRNLDFVVTGKNKPFIDGGYDVIEPATLASQINAQLKRLDPEHPFYTATIPLGDIRKIFGIFPSFFRRGAPGSDLYAPDQLKKFSDLIQFFYFTPGDPNFGKIIKESFQDWNNIDISIPIEYNSLNFGNKIKTYY